MRRLLYTSAFLLGFCVLVWSQGKPRGDIWSARAIRVLENMFSPAGQNRYPHFSTPPTCDTNNSGGFYYDTDDDTHHHCDGTAWNAVLGMPSGGTPGRVPKFATASTLSDSDLNNDGIPAAGAGGNIVDLTVTLNAGDGDDTIRGLLVDITNADHTGGAMANLITGISIGGITEDTQGNEQAFTVGSGWDSDMAFEDTTALIELSSTAGSNLTLSPSDSQPSLILTDRGLAGASSTYLELDVTNLAMNEAGDVITGFLIDFNGTPDHTNGSLRGLAIDLEATDPNAVETAIFITSTWEQGVRGPDGTASLPAYAFNTNPASGLYLPSSGLLGITVNGSDTMVLSQTNSFGASADLVEITKVFNAMNGSDTLQALLIDVTNADHTGTLNEFRGIFIDGIVGDAEAAETAIFVGSDWENVLAFEGATDDAFETSITITDPTVDNTLNIPDAGGAFFVSTLAANGPDVALSVWGENNTIAFEGTTANAFEARIDLNFDPAADTSIALNAGATSVSLMVSSDTLNAVDAGNSVWGGTNQFIFEGATADAFELIMAVTDPTADRTITWPDDNIDWVTGLSDNDVMKYDSASRTWAPEADATSAAPCETAEGAFHFPNEIFYDNTDNSGAIVTSNNQVAVWRLYLDRCITVDLIVIKVDTAQASGLVGIGIYNEDGTTLHVETGGVDASSSGVKDTDVTNTDVGPGYILVAFTSNDAATTPITIFGRDPSGAGTDIANSTVVQFGTAANASASGVLPATTGTVTAAELVRPFVKFQN